MCINYLQKLFKTKCEVPLDRQVEVPSTFPTCKRVSKSKNLWFEIFVNLINLGVLRIGF